MKYCINKRSLIVMICMLFICVFIGCTEKVSIDVKKDENIEKEITTTDEQFYTNYLNSFSQEDISYGLTTTKKYYKDYDSVVETNIIFLSKNVLLIKDTIGDNYDYGKEMVIEAQIYVNGTECDRVLLLRKNDDGNWHVDSEKKEICGNFTSFMKEKR